VYVVRYLKIVGLMYMTTPNKYSTKIAIADSDDFDDFSCTERGDPVDHDQIREDCIAAVESAKIATGFAIKLCLHNLRINIGDWFAVGGTTYDCHETLKNMVAYQVSEEIIAVMPKMDTGSGMGKNTNKKMITAQRVARAFAPTVIFLLSKSKIKLPADNERDAKDAGLPLQFGFIDAPYGMNDQELKTHMSAFKKYLTNFMKRVRASYNSGRMETKTGRERNHVEEFENYVKWRGLDLS
jgi:hypothetical protein